MKKIIVCALFLLITGCGTLVYQLDTPPVSNYPAEQKINLTIELRISEELERFAHESAAENLPLGNILIKNAENMSRALFRQVVITKKTDKLTHAGVNAVLIPKVVSIAHTRPMYAYSERKLTVIFQWLLKDSEGKTIWMDTIEGEGTNDIGTLFSLESNTRERVRLLMEDLFKKSYLSISSSKEIENFKSKK